MSIYRTHNIEELPNKYLKKMFGRPHKAYCRKCLVNNRRHKMFLLPEDANPGKILFKCTNPVCGNILNLTDYLKQGYKMNKDKLHKMKTPDNLGPLVKMSLTVHHYRIQDRYYQIDNVYSYNPFTRMKRGGQAFTKALEEEHNKLLGIIRESLSNAKSN